MNKLLICSGIYIYIYIYIPNSGIPQVLYSITKCAFAKGDEKIENR